jgi:cytochrome c
MKFAPKTAAAFVPVLLALAACGGGDDADDGDAAPVNEGPVATGTAAPASISATPTRGETPTATPSATPSPTPTATATTAAASEPGAFSQCKACHSVEPGKNGIGPTLAGIYGDKAATVPGFEFSEAMKNSGLTWNQATLDRYLTDPRGVVPGTKMAFGGVKDAAQRQAIINYLKTL